MSCRVRLEDLQIAASNAQLDFVHNLPQQFDTYVGSGGSALFFVLLDLPICSYCNGRVVVLVSLN